MAGRPHSAVNPTQPPSLHDASPASCETGQRRLQQAILNNIPGIAWLKDRGGRYIAANQAFARFAGVGLDEVIGMTDGDLWTPKQAQRYEQDDRQVLSGGHPLSFEEEFSDQSGRGMVL